jgi:hypothetical protein
VVAGGGVVGGAVAGGGGVALGFVPFGRCSRADGAEWRVALSPRSEGARASPAVSGSEARPICWLASPLAAMEIPAAIRMPSSARPIQRTVAGTLIDVRA